MVRNQVNTGGEVRELLEDRCGRHLLAISHLGAGQPPADGVADEGGRLMDV
jgi:hypothetical protein